MKQFCDFIDGLPAELFYGGLLIIVVLVMIFEYRGIKRGE